MWRRMSRVSVWKCGAKQFHVNPIRSTQPPNRAEWLQHRASQLGSFTQEKPDLQNPFDNDPFAQTLLATHLPLEAWNQIKPDLHRFGHRIVTEIDALGLQCEQHKPHLETVDAWGDPVNRLHVSDAWKQQKRIAAEEQLIRIGYDRPFAHFRYLIKIHGNKMTIKGAVYVIDCHFACPVVPIK
jgi:hypothetical protein